MILEHTQFQSDFETVYSHLGSQGVWLLSQPWLHTERESPHPGIAELWSMVSDLQQLVNPGASRPALSSLTLGPLDTPAMIEEKNCKAFSSFLLQILKPYKILDLGSYRNITVIGFTSLLTLVVALQQWDVASILSYYKYWNSIVLIELPE